MSKIIGLMCLIVAFIIALDLLPIPNERNVYVCIFIMLGNLFINKKDN